MKIEFKINELIEDEEKTCDVKILIAIISLFKNDTFSPTKTYALIFDIESASAKALMKNPNLPYSIDLNSFILKKIQFKNIEKDFGYFQNALIDRMDESKTNQELDEDEISNSLNECLFSCHAEMYLYFNYKVVLNREFNKITYDNNFKESILNKFSNIISVILKDNFELRTDEYKKLSNVEIKEIQLRYDDSIDYAQGFINSIAYFVINNKIATYISSEILNDKEFFYNLYIQKVFIKALSICEKRIISQQNSGNYFGHEIVFSEEQGELKIFPTPFGFTQSNKIEKLARAGKLDDYLITYLANNKFIKIEDENLLDVLKTKWTFKHTDIITAFYVDRKHILAHNDFGKQNRNEIFSSLMNNGQINLSLSSIIPNCA